MLAGADRPLFLQNNDLLREIFGLGPPLVLDAATLKASKVSRFEKVGVPSQTCASSPFLQHHGLQPSTWVWWVPAGGSGSRAPTHLTLLLSPCSTSTTRLPSKPARKPGAGCGTNGQTCCDGRRGAEPPAHLDCRPSTVRGGCPQPSGFYSCTAEYLMPGAAPPGAAPAFIFLTKEKKDKSRAGGRWWHAAVPPLGSWGSARHSGKGSCRARVSPPQPLRSTQVAWHCLKGRVGRAEPRRAAGRLALVTAPATGVLPPASPASLAPGVVAERHGVGGPALPCQLPAPNPLPAKCFLGNSSLVGN